jgi:hypothetical protein
MRCHRCVVDRSGCTFAKVIWWFGRGNEAIWNAGNDETGRVMIHSRRAVGDVAKLAKLFGGLCIRLWCRGCFSYGLSCLTKVFCRVLSAVDDVIAFLGLWRSSRSVL